LKNYQIVDKSYFQLDTSIEVSTGKHNNLYGMALFLFGSAIKYVRAICWRKLTNGSTDLEVLGTIDAIV